MNNWIRVVTDPLGLAGFALFLVFTLAGRLRQTREHRWLPRAFVALAVIALVGGLLLSFSRQLPQGRADFGRERQGGAVIQHTQGDRSPAISGVGGNVTITNVEEEKEAHDGAHPTAAPAQDKP